MEFRYFVSRRQNGNRCDLSEETGAKSLTLRAWCRRSKGASQRMAASGRGRVKRTSPPAIGQFTVVAQDCSIAKTSDEPILSAIELPAFLCAVSFTRPRSIVLKHSTIDADGSSRVAGGSSLRLAVATENRIRAGAHAAMGYPRFGMLDLLKLLGGVLVGVFRSHAAREAETAFLRQQLVVLQRSAPARLRLRTADRLIFVWLYRLFPSVLEAAVVFKPETLVRWHRSGFRLYWRWKSRRRVGRPAVPADI